MKGDITMTKYIITDPCYLLDDKIWQECCDAGALPNGGWDNEAFNQKVAQELTKLSGAKAYACHTGFGDWTNKLSGPNVEADGVFYADSGMVCVCKIDAAIMNKYSLRELKRLGAVFHTLGEIEVKFNTEDPCWTEVHIKDTVNCMYWNTSGAQSDFDEEYE